MFILATIIILILCSEYYLECKVEGGEERKESPHVALACRSVEVAQASDDFTERFDQSLGVHILVHQSLVL